MIRKDLRDKRAALVAENRALTEKAQTEKRELNGDELTSFEARMNDVDVLTRQIRAEERQAEQEAANGRPANNRQSGQGAQADGEYRNLGHFVHDVRFNADAVQQRALSMGTGSEGGYAVPTEFRPELLSVNPEQAIVRPRAMVIPAGETSPDAELKMPALDQGANGAYGGVTLTWISEGVAKPETSAGVLEVTLQPNECAAHIVMTDKLLRNWQAANAVVTRLLRQAMVGGEDYKFLRGNGTGCPKGILSTACKILVNRNTASHVKFADIAAMLGRILPDSLGNCVFVANISVLSDLVQMSSDSNGVSTVFIRGDATKGIPSTLFGVPVLFTGRTPVLGTAGDLMLLDLSYYLIKDGSGPFIAASPHVKFLENKTVIKAFWNVDGDAWPAAALLLEDGTTTVSPFVVLN